MFEMILPPGLNSRKSDPEPNREFLRKPLQRFLQLGHIHITVIHRFLTIGKYLSLIDTGENMIDLVLDQLFV
jgi:hypothetical protein